MVGRKLVRAMVAAAMALPLALGQPAYAVHLFPLTPVFDPLGHDCAKGLTPAPAGGAATVDVAGFSFLDQSSNSSATFVDAGESVTWTWLMDHCHSVTFADGSGTSGATGFQPAQPQLVRLGAGDSFSVTFASPGTYAYACVHHGSVGMTGVVIVT